jgi:hydroxymethylpyrimidine/phosphomethylpyrimidine kinase
VVYLESEDLDAWVERLRADGIVFESGPADQSWGWREARLRDPAGNRLCLYRAGEFRRFPPWRIG